MYLHIMYFLSKLYVHQLPFFSIFVKNYTKLDTSLQTEYNSLLGIIHRIIHDIVDLPGSAL